MKLRWMIRGDLPNVVAIEHDCFGNGWSEKEFLAELRQRNVIGMVVEDDDERIVGYIVYAFEADCFRVKNFAVAHDARRIGVGKLMLSRVQLKTTQKRRRIEILVRETNLRCLLFLRSIGFRATRINRSPYDDADEDGILMEFVNHTINSSSTFRGV